MRDKVIARRRLGAEASEEGGAEAGFLTDEVESADDSGFGAMTFARDLGGAEQLDAIKAEDFGDGRGRAATTGIEFIQESESESGDVRAGWVVLGRGVFVLDRCG